MGVAAVLLLGGLKLPSLALPLLALALALPLALAVALALALAPELAPELLALACWCAVARMAVLLIGLAVSSALAAALKVLLSQNVLLSQP